MEPEIRSDREIRLEELKSVSNAHFDYLKRLYDRRPVWKLYAQGEIELHIHYAMHGMYCATYRALEPRISLMAFEESGTPILPPNFGEVPVLVPVREVSEYFSPLASLVRLQNLNVCDMCGVHALEPSVFPSRETIFRAFHGKLGHVLGLPGVEPREIKDQKVHGAPEIVTNLSNEDPEDERGGGISVWRRHFEVMRRIKIEMTNHGVLLAPREGFDIDAKILKVFICPSHPC